MKEAFTRNQRRIFLLCFACYGSAYVGRLNMSAALNGLATDLSLTDARAGVFQTVFALIYSLGQIVNGSLVDRISARRYIGTGLLLSAACNALFGMTSNYTLLVILWALNGAAQSMLWTPVVKLLTVWFKGSRRDRASFGLSLTMILGHLAAWGVSGALASMMSWRYAFFVSAAVVGIAGIAGLVLITDAPAPGEDIGTAADVAAAPEKSNGNAMPLGRLLGSTGLGLLLLCCICNGFVRDGIVTWAPTILANAQEGLAIDSTLLTLIIPAINAVGIITVKKCYHVFGDSSRIAVAALMIVSGILAFLMLPAGMGMIVCAALMGLCCAANYGVNPMLTTLIPMEYENTGRVGLVAGLMDCFIYLGSALAGVAVGAMSDSFGWNWVYAAWGIVSLLGAALAFMSVRGKKNIAA